MPQVQTKINQQQQSQYSFAGTTVSDSIIQSISQGSSRNRPPTIIP